MMSVDRTPQTEMHAWIDESGSNYSLDPGIYILAVVITMTEREEDTRRVMEELRLPGQRKLHWRDENPQRQRHITATVAGLKQAYVERATPATL